MFGGSPGVHNPPPPAPPDETMTDEYQRKIALQRKTLDARRASRKSFVVDPTAIAGLRIPQSGG